MQRIVKVKSTTCEDYYRTQNDLKELMKRRDIKLAVQDATIKEQDATIKKYLAIMAEHGIQPD